MAVKLTARQQSQLAWLEALRPKLDRARKVIELMASRQADEAMVRSLARQLDELKVQAGSLSITALAESFGYMGTMMRRAGGHQVKVRGLQELLASAKTNFEGAVREASMPPKEVGTEAAEPTPP